MSFKLLPTTCSFWLNNWVQKIKALPRGGAFIFLYLWVPALVKLLIISDTAENSEENALSLRRKYLHNSGPVMSDQVFIIEAKLCFMR